MVDLTGGYAGFLGIWTAIAVVVSGLLLLKMSKFRLPLVSNVAAMVPVKFSFLFLASAAVLWLFPMFGIGLVPKTLAVGSTTSISTAVLTPNVGQVCNRPQGGNTATFQLTAENIDNPADAYIGHQALFVNDATNQIIQTGGLATGTTLSYTSFNLDPCIKGTLYLTGNSTSKISFDTYEPLRTVKANTAVGTNVTVDILNFNTGSSIVANGTRPTDGTTICPSVVNCGAWAGGTQPTLNNIVVQNQTVGSGGSFNFKYTLAGASANGRLGQFAGVNGDGYVVSARISDLTSISNTKGVTLSSPDGGATLREVDCKDAGGVVSNRNANKCWIGSTLKSGFTYTGSGTILSDLGDSAPQDYVDLCWDDLNYVQDNDGVVKLLAFTSTGTNVGAAETCVRFFLN